MNIQVTTQPATPQELDLVRQGIFEAPEFPDAEAEAMVYLQGVTTSTSRLVTIDSEVVRVCWTR